MSKLKVSFGGHSSSGVKDENQDALAAYAPEGAVRELKGVVATIADGVSSSKYAREASNTCATMFIQDYFETPDTWSVERSAASIIQSLNAWCCAQDGPNVSSAVGLDSGNFMTTFSSVVLRSRKGYIFHVGDSRVYRYRKGELEQLTRDHKQKQGDKTYLTRAIGIDPHVDVDYLGVDLEVGDLLMLTTDGVHDFVARSDFVKLLSRSHISLEVKAQAIVSQAEAKLSDDNVSCLIVKIDALPPLGEDQFYRAALELAIPPPLETGNILDGYRVEEILFEGTRSYVYKVLCLESKNIYALKAPTEYHRDDSVFLRGFAQEQWVGLSIDHENVMNILPRKANSAFLYHVCEFIEGQTLRQWMVDNPLPSLDKVRAIVVPVVSALRKMQRLDMVHRDLKPENIMITRDGKVKLVDFGTVRVASIDVSHDAAMNEPQGSCNYIAPESVLNNECTHGSDLFSLGVIVYEMLSNRLPFKPFPYKDYMPKSLSAWDYIPLHRTSAEHPVWVDMALRKACAPDAESRYSSYSEFQADLTSPNEAHMNAVKHAPLIEKNPLLFWQVSAAVLFVLNLVQLVRWLA